MKITFLASGKPGEDYLKEGIAVFEKRLKHYIPFFYHNTVLPRPLKSSSPADQCSQEADMLLKFLRPDDHVVLLDDKGVSYTSVEFAGYLQRLMNAGIRHCVFISGGPFGFDPRLYARAEDTMSLSRMTFTHQMVRLIFTEQLYRAMTILRNEKYHH